jgi:hypothetical protein
LKDFKQIVWLASYPKSGNTWLRLLFDAYYLNDLDINEIVCSIGDDGVVRHMPGDGIAINTAPVDVQQLTHPMAMLRTVLAYDAVKAKIPLLVKTHQPNMVANGIELLPECLTKATILIVRDPRDVFPSFANHMGSTHDEAVEQMKNKYQILSANEQCVSNFLSSWDAHTESYLAPSNHNVLVVKYEVMRADPEGEFARILKHIGEKPDMERVKRAVEMTDIAKLNKLEKEHGFREGSYKAKDPFFNTGQVGKKIAPHHKSMLERAFRKTMLKLGYLGRKSANGTVELH